MTDPAPTPDDGTQVMAAFIPASPMVRHLGIAIGDLGDGVVRLTLPFAEHLVTVGQAVHGGAIATLVDTAVMAASWSGAPVPEKLRGSTVDLTVHYLAPAERTGLTATARVLRRGRTLTHVEVAVEDDTGQAVAHALGTYRLG